MLNELVITIYSEPEPIRSIEKDYKKEGPWTLDELITLVPEKLTAGMTPLVTPAT